MKVDIISHKKFIVSNEIFFNSERISIIFVDSRADRGGILGTYITVSNILIIIFLYFQAVNRFKT